MGPTRREQRINGRDGALVAHGPIASNSSDPGLHAGQELSEPRLNLRTPVAPIPHPVGHPRYIRLEQQIQIGSAFRCQCFKKLRTPAEIVVAIHHRAHQIGITEQQGVTPLLRQRHPGIFERHLAAGNRAMITKAQGRPLLERVTAHELRHHNHAVMGPQRFGERGLADGLRSGQDDAGDAGGGVSAVRLADRVHCTRPRMARPRKTA